MMVLAYYLWLKKYFKCRNFYMTKYIIKYRQNLIKQLRKIYFPFICFPSSIRVYMSKSFNCDFNKIQTDFSQASCSFHIDSIDYDTSLLLI